MSAPHPFVRLIALTFAAVVVLTTSLLATAPMTTATVHATSMTAPLTFTENQGQWPDSILFRADAGRAALWFTAGGTYYQFTRQVGGEEYSPDYETMMIKAGFVGSSSAPKAYGVRQSTCKCNYFLGNDSTKWRTDVRNFEAIVLEEIYPGIDLTYYGNEGAIEYDFRVAPGADYSQVRILYEGANGLSVAEDGALVIETDWGEMRELAPVVYQEIAGERKGVRASYVLHDDHGFGLALSSDYNPEYAVVIDPVLSFSTYLGAPGVEQAHGIAVGDDGSVYVTGVTSSLSFPTVNPFQTNQPEQDVFVTRFASSGTSLIFSTFVGGDSNDFGLDLVLDQFGNAYVTGMTQSTDFPTLNEIQSNQPDHDAFVFKLSSTGGGLAYSTYLGGVAADFGYGIAVDTARYAYVTGSTGSPDFPTRSAYQTNQPGVDAFVSRISPDGGSLLYSTYLGGGDQDDARDIVVDVKGSAYVTGYTRSNDFPTVNPYQTYVGPAMAIDAFVTKIAVTGQTLIYSTYLCGNGNDYGEDIDIDNSGRAHVVGRTNAGDFPTHNPLYSYSASSDVFVTALSSSGDSLEFGTMLPGGSVDEGFGIDLNDSGYIAVTGRTYSTDFVLKDPYQADTGSVDVFVTLLAPLADSVIYSTYLGGNLADNGTAVALDDKGYAYVTGLTYSSDFPLKNEYQVFNGPANSDAFVTKLCQAFMCGDVNHDTSLDIADLTYLVAYMFKSGPEPPIMEAANVNAQGDIDIADLTYLVNYMFKQGSDPTCP